MSGKLQSLVERFRANINFYTDTRNSSYNEHSCRNEFIDPLLEILGWDVANAKGVAPQYREVIAENYSSRKDRPDYTLTLRGVPKFFVEAKKPSVDITKEPAPAIQTRKYGWNAKHRLAVLTNFEYLAIYDTCHIVNENDSCTVARYRLYHYSEYVDKINEISELISRDAVYSGKFDSYLDLHFPATEGQAIQVDKLFLTQINKWRVDLSNELYKGSHFKSLEKLSDVVQEFINQIVFLRICEDKNLSPYHNLKNTTINKGALQTELEKLFREADHRYNSGMFSGPNIIFNLSSGTIMEMIEELYYPQSPYLFNIIEPNLLGKIYEMFLTEQLTLFDNGKIGLSKKRDCQNRSIVTTPAEIVKYMVHKTLSKVCEGKTPSEILDLRVADIACGSGIFLEEAFDFLQAYCVQWYIKNGEIRRLIEVGTDLYKLPLQEKKNILCSCIYGIDIDVHAVEVAKFSLLLKLIEDETAPSVSNVSPILPNLDSNIQFGNSLVGSAEIEGIDIPEQQSMEIAPFDWDTINNGELFDVIIGNPPYVNTEGMYALLSSAEMQIYRKKYQTAYKQFDKYFLFLERAINKVKDNGLVCYIVPNKFFKVGAGEKIRDLIAKRQMLVSLNDFGDTQLFDDKTIYSAIILLSKASQPQFIYSYVDSADKLWAEEDVPFIELKSSILNKLPWRLTTDLEFLTLLQRLDNVSVPITKYVQIFNGIQTSAERPVPIYWFSSDEVVAEDTNTIQISKEGHVYTLDKALLRPYFKPTKKAERGMNSYSVLKTDKQIIFPYDNAGDLIPIDEMMQKYPHTYAYLKAYYNRLVPRNISAEGVRDVPNATPDTWYQYGRTQALTAFINTPKLIVGILSKEPMYVMDKNNFLIASGGTAGYCAISKLDSSPYELEYIQAWLSNPITERIIKITGSDFEGGFTARGTFVLSTLPFVELDFNIKEQKAVYDKIVTSTRRIYAINEELTGYPDKRKTIQLQREKKELISRIEKLISCVYRQDFRG